MKLLRQNIETNASEDARVEKLIWGSDKALKSLGLEKCPDLVVASDVVYGNDPVKWANLVQTMRDLSGPKTLLLIANVQRYPLHHPLAETRFYTEATAEYFDRVELPVNALHPDFRRTGAGNCVIHVFRPRFSDKKRKADSSESLKQDENDVKGRKDKKKKAKKEKKEKTEKNDKTPRK